MAVSKVTFDGNTLIDLENDTTDAAYTLNGYTGHKADGTTFTGSIATKTSSNVTHSGRTVTIPAGYYASQVQHSVDVGSVILEDPLALVANPVISVNSSTGLITATVSGSGRVEPTLSPGYVSSVSDADVTVSGSATSQLSTQAGTTITPTTSQQTAVAAHKYTLGAVKVGAIPSQYIIPTGTYSITANGTGIDISAYAAVDVAVPSSGATITQSGSTLSIS